MEICTVVKVFGAWYLGWVLYFTVELLVLYFLLNYGPQVWDGAVTGRLAMLTLFHISLTIQAGGKWPARLCGLETETVAILASALFKCGDSSRLNHYSAT